MEGFMGSITYLPFNDYTVIPLDTWANMMSWLFNHPGLKISFPGSRVVMFTQEGLVGTFVRIGWDRSIIK